MANDPGVIQQIVAPAVLVSASGLLLLSSTARMNTVLARIRAFHHERLDVWRLEHEAGSRNDRVRSLRLEGLQRQTDRLLVRAGLLRVTMLQLFGSIVCYLASVVIIAIRFLVEPEPSWLYEAGVWVFMGGILLTLGAMLTSALEVGRILETLRYEHDRVEKLCATDPPASPRDVHPTPKSGEGMGL